MDALVRHPAAQLHVQLISHSCRHADGGQLHNADDASLELTRIPQDNANHQAVIETAREQNKQLKVAASE